MTKRILTFIVILLTAWTAASQEDQYLLPLRFAIIGDGVEQLPLELDYDLENQKSLRIGDIHINSETFQIQLGLLGELFPAAEPFLTEDEKAESLLLFRWPSPILTDGSVEAVGSSGRILWSAKIHESDTLAWSNKLQVIRERMAERLRKNDIEAIALFKTTWAFRNFLKSETDFLNTNESFRACVSRQNEHGQTRICSPFLKFVKRNRKWAIERQPEPEKPARVIGYQKLAPLKARKVIKVNAPIQFLAELSQGLIYEFVSRPPKVNIVEMVAEGANSAKVVGFGQRPTRENQILNPLNQNFLSRVFKWEETIGDLRRFWETSVAVSEPTLYFSGPGGGIFKQQFKVARLPRESARAFLHRKTPDSTYVNGPWLAGVKAKNTKVGSTERRLTMENDEEFEWSFQALKRGDMNRSHILIEDSGQKFKAYYEMYKGYPRELSFRVSGIVGSNNNLTLNAEGSFNYWFEDIFGWTNYYLSRQRWGISYKYFQSLNSLRFSPLFAAPMQTHTFDLKYRLTPGLWNRDESWGAMLAFNGFKYDFIEVQELGAGVFWARSMPKLFDDMFNYFSIFRYPKWVDMEFIYYAVSTEPKLNRLVANTGTLGNWALNFHGKVMWTKSWFGEAGFGIRTIAVVREQVSPYDSSSLRTNLTFSSFYGTFGMGYQF